MPDEPEISLFRSDRPDSRKVLGDLEAEVMEVIWSRPSDVGTMVRDVFEALYAHRRIAYTTVITTMTRMATKHLLRTERVERAFVYYPVLTQQQFVSRFVGRILEDLLISFTGDPGESIAAAPDARTVARACVLLDGIERRRAAEDA